MSENNEVVDSLPWRKQILLISQDRFSASFLQDAFLKRGYSVLVYGTVEQALDWLRRPCEIRERQELMAAILDVDMSLRQRRFWLQTLRGELDSFGGHDQELPLVVLASPSVLSRSEAYHWGATLVLSKPLQPGSLLDQVEHMAQPKQVRWQSGQQQQKASDLEVAVDPDHVQFGRGGLAVQSDRAALEGQRVTFSVQIHSGSSPFRGVGVVRYVSSSPSENPQSVLGLEIVGLDPHAMKQWPEIERSLVSRSSFIPQKVSSRGLH